MAFQKYFENYENTRIEDYDLHSVRKFHNRITSNVTYMASNFLEIISYQNYVAQLQYFMNCDGKRLISWIMDAVSCVYSIALWLSTEWLSFPWSNVYSKCILIKWLQSARLKWVVYHLLNPLIVKENDLCKKRNQLNLKVKWKNYLRHSEMWSW